MKKLCYMVEIDIKSHWIPHKIFLFWGMISEGLGLSIWRQDTLLAKTM